jgi:hypothetical protein
VVFYFSAVDYARCSMVWREATAAAPAEGKRSINQHCDVSIKEAEGASSLKRILIVRQ